MKRVFAAFASCFFIGALLVLSTESAVGQTVVAGEDFDGGALNLTSGFDVSDNLDGGGGDWYGIGNLDAWPQADGVPFSIVDQSGTVFTTDLEGILSDLTSDRSNVFFSISDTREWTDDNNGDPTNPLITSWTFDISSATGPLRLNIDMGQCSDGAAFSGFTEGFVLFEYSIDGGAFQTAMSCDSFDSAGSGFVYRNMDVIGDPGEDFVCQATGPGTITKISAEDGSVSPNTILDKCPPVGSGGEGTLDTFETDIVGTGNSIELRMTTAIAFEAFVFDNIEITESAGGPVTVTADSFTVTRGTYVSGGLPELAASDNMDLSIRRNSGDTSSRTEFEVKGTSPTETPVSFGITVEGSAFFRSTVVQTIELFDYDAGVWVLVDTQNASRLVDSVVSLTGFGGDLGRFVEDGTRSIEARIHFESLSRRQNFASNTDQVVWTIE